MPKLFRMIAIAALGGAARTAWRRRAELAGRARELRSGPGAAPPALGSSRISGRDGAVDHERQPGVPPPANDDYDDAYDQAVAGTFPASDPASTW